MVRSDNRRIYQIERFFQDGRPKKIIETDLTLAEAQKHCDDPTTSKEDEWFDGYNKIPGES